MRLFPSLVASLSISYDASDLYLRIKNQSIFTLKWNKMAFVCSFCFDRKKIFGKKQLNTNIQMGKKFVILKLYRNDNDKPCVHHQDVRIVNNCEKFSVSVTFSRQSACYYLSAKAFKNFPPEIHPLLFYSVIKRKKNNI